MKIISVSPRRTGVGEITQVRLLYTPPPPEKMEYNHELRCTTTSTLLRTHCNIFHSNRSLSAHRRVLQRVYIYTELELTVIRELSHARLFFFRDQSRLRMIDIRAAVKTTRDL